MSFDSRCIALFESINVAACDRFELSYLCCLVRFCKMQIIFSSFTSHGCVEYSHKALPRCITDPGIQLGLQIQRRTFGEHIIQNYNYVFVILVKLLPCPGSY